MADIIFPGATPAVSLGSTWLPQNVDLTIWRGDKQEYVVAFTDNNGNPVDLTGQVPKAQIKQNYSSVTSYNFTCTIQNSNQVKIYLSTALSETLVPGDYIWDFQLTDVSGDVRTYLAGDVSVLGEVTT